ncbi:MAG: lactate permease LctP family transporter [Bacteroidetes bacterium]|nr:lactate permease LctP family transporter [Bacteroidota bacterium]
MNWTQVIDPFQNMPLSAFIAALPVLFIFTALILLKMKGHIATLLTTLLAIGIAIGLYRMPAKLALLSAADGALYGLFTISWIIIGAMFLYNITVKSGRFEVIKNFMASITTDRRLQALLIAFSFGAFLEGAAGFGTPVAITAAMLVGLGFNPLYAAGICLIANTAPVAFGSIGIPITVAAQTSGLPEMAVSQMVGRTLPFLSLLVPFYLVFIMAGYKRTMEVLPAILVSGGSFAITQFVTANYINHMLPDVVSGFVSIVSLMILLRFWKPKTVWRFKEEPVQTIDGTLRYSAGEILRAWSPFIIMTALVMTWGLQPVKDWLNAVGQIKFYLPGLHDQINTPDAKPLVIKPFTFSYLSNAGTSILLAAVISLPLIGMGLKEAARIFLRTIVQLKFSLLTIASVVGFAYIANNSGMSLTMATALAGTGVLFPFFSPLLGWLGVFLTGSDTAANALFCKLQYSSAQSLGIDPVITVSANATGGVTAKMISPQSIAVGSAAVGLVGKESNLFRFTVRHSFIMLLIVCCFTILQAYVLRWMIPSY